MKQKELKTETMTDKIEKIQNSLIQHGKENDRIYLMKLHKNDYVTIPPTLNKLANENKYSKILAKVPLSAKEKFIKSGYEIEAKIPAFFKGEEEVVFLSKYLTKERKFVTDKNKLVSIVDYCLKKASKSEEKELEKDFSIRQMTGKDAPHMVELYKKVFESYPFPIFDENYIQKTMKSHINYFGAFYGDKLAALSSSEMDLENLNTEMTDFATLPKYRGKNLSYHLLKEMEKAAIKKGIKTFYTIARAKAVGMNMTFAQNNYDFVGSLMNNTHICGELETMNVWYKNVI